VSWTLGPVSLDDEELPASISVQRPSLVQVVTGSDHRDYAYTRYQGSTPRHWGDANIECSWDGISATAMQKLRYLASFGGRFALELDIAQIGPAVICTSADQTIFYTPDAPLKTGSVTVYVDDVEVSADDYTLDAATGKITFDVALDPGEVVTAEYIWTPYVVALEPNFGHEGNDFESGSVSLVLKEVA